MDDMRRWGGGSEPAKHPGSKVHFKFTCPACGERCVLEEADTLYERGTCFKCGADSPIEKAGFLLIVDRPQPIPEENGSVH
jgi:hypothetical protein